MPLMTYRTAHKRRSDSENTISVVASAAQLALFNVASSSPAQREDERDADKRQEDDAGEDAEAEHQRMPPTRYQVMTSGKADQHGECVIDRYSRSAV